MKRILTLFAITCCVAFVTGTAFATSIVILPETVSPEASVTKGIYTNPESASPDALTLKSAVSDFKALSKAEKKERFKDAKAALKAYRKEKKEGKVSDADTKTASILEIILTIILPPVGVLVHEGRINGKFWLDLLLTLLFYVPGLVYGLIVVLSKD